MKVNALVGYQKWEEMFVEIPDEIFNEALKEKKESISFWDYTFKARSGLFGGLPKYDAMRDYIIDKLGYKIDYKIKRIHII